MDNVDNIVDVLLEKTCYVIDFLPEQVSKQSKGQFFDVEDYLLNYDKHVRIKDKFENVILKLMCYYRMVIWQNGRVEYSKPEAIVKAINEIMINHIGRINFLFPDENTLLVFE